MNTKEKLIDIKRLFNRCRGTGTTTTLLDIAKSKKCTVFTYDTIGDITLTKKLGENPISSVVTINQNLEDYTAGKDLGTILVDTDVLIVVVKESLELINKLEAENTKLKEDFEKIKTYNKLREELSGLV